MDRITFDSALKAAASLAYEDKQAFSALLAAAVGDIKPSAVAVSSAKGGTKQIRNRLAQHAVKHATELIVFLVRPTDDLDASIKYLRTTLSGTRDVSPPAGPVLFVVHSDDGIVRPVALVLNSGSGSRTSRFVSGMLPEVPVSEWRPELAKGVPDDVRAWLLMSSDDTGRYGDIDGVRYHYPSHIPNGKNVAVGDYCFVARTKSSGTADRGTIFGIARVGRVLAVSGGTHRYAYYDRYLQLPASVPLEEIGDPRANVNSITKVQDAWARDVLGAAGSVDLTSLPVPMTALSLGALQDAAVEAQLIIDPSVLEQVLAALRNGKNVMLTGAPGTGKTTLALLLANVASRAGLCDEPVLTTGTADWTSADTVGAYRLDQDQRLLFSPGQIVHAMATNRWVVIDELNRADIDKAIGQLFTTLSGHPVVLPFVTEQDGVRQALALVPPGADAPPDTNQINVPANWRLIATLNDRDRDLLFDMSEALMRRFAVIEMRPPTAQDWRLIMRNVGGCGDSRLDEAMTALVETPELRTRPVGAAVLLDCVRHLRELVRLSEEEATPLDLSSALQRTVDLYLAPQLQEVARSVDLDVRSLVPAATSAGSESPSGQLTRETPTDAEGGTALPDTPLSR